MVPRKNDICLTVNGLGSPTPFEKRFLDFQKILINMTFIVFFSSCPFV